MTNIATIGTGGIGSYFAEHIDRLITIKQIKNCSFTFYDDDIIEKKNILYQNFKTKDIGLSKIRALQDRYINLNFVKKRVSLNDLIREPSSLTILCVDNNKIRADIYSAGCKFIDSRANGRCIGIFSSNTTNYLETLGDTTEETSCQNPFQIANDEIEFGNVAIAAILAQVVLNYIRNSRLPNDLMLNL